MDAKQRRDQIAALLKGAQTPLTGGELARRFGVSRQVIVGDIALLRTGGLEVYATPEGYLLPKDRQGLGHSRVLAAVHIGPDALLDELLTVVDLGGMVVDVCIEHAVYGEFRAPLMIRDRAGAEGFARALKESRVEPLSALTGGVHLHTLSAADEQTLDKIEQALKQKGYLLDMEE